MKILPVTHQDFKQYGQVLEGYDVKELLSCIDAVTPMPEDGTVYVPSQPELEELSIAAELSQRAFGGMPIQLGFCNGYNTKLNCLEYHRDSELNLGTKDFILLLAKREEIENGMLDTGRVRAFLVPAGTLVEVYATTLHYAPCQASGAEGFKVLIVLPEGTNLEKPEIEIKNDEDRCLAARNKWLLAHVESNEAASGAMVRLKGKNIDIADQL